MMNLSENFTLEELCVTKNSNFRAMQMSPNPIVVDNLKRLCSAILQPLRNHLQRPLTVNSGYRSEMLNKYVKGAANSYHIYGCAADLKMDNWKMAYECAAFVASNCPFNECILSCNKHSIWLHVAYRLGDTKNYVGFQQY